MISSDIIRKIADIGFMATSGGFFRQADIIFKALELNKKDNVLPYMGMVLNLMNMENNEAALLLLEKKALVLEPDNDILHAFKAMVLMLLGRNIESENDLNRIIKNSKDKIATNLAENILNQMSSKSQ